MGKALIAGLGIQGIAIAHALHALGFDVIAIDQSEDTLNSSVEFLDNLGVSVRPICGDATDVKTITDQKPDVLISALPFSLNLQLATSCIENKIRYCDLGGNVQTSNEIRRAVEKSSGLPVMTDLGLAPGIANIIAELGYRHLGKADSVKIRVGGLPVEPEGALKYGLTFSPLGLFNEYREKCYAIFEGSIISVDPLTEIEKLEFEGLGELEAFNTSGGTSNTIDVMLKRGVRECNYKTIRFPGHVELIRFMLLECRMDLETFSEAVINACGFIKRDQVLMVIDLAADGGSSKWLKKFRVLHDENFTAMQKTTGYGTAAVAAILGTGILDGKRYITYADIPLDDFAKNMSKLLPELDL